MLKKVVEIITIMLIITLLITLNEEMLPQRREITDTSIIKVVGLDIENDESVITAVTVNTEQNSASGGENSSTGSSGKNGIIVAKGESFKIAEKLAQASTDKKIEEGHVSYFFVGEETAKNNFIKILNYIVTNEEVRFSTKIYVVKNYSAQDFIQKVVNTEYELGEKLQNIEDINKKFGIAAEIRLSDILKMIESQQNIGIVPALEIEEEDIMQKEENSNESSNQKSMNFNIAGYGVFNQSNLIGYLSMGESIGVNFLKNEIMTTSVVIEDSKKNKLEVAIIKSDTKVTFSFEEDVLKKIYVNIDLSSNIEEADLIEEYFNPEERVKLENQLQDKIKEFVQSSIDKAKEYDIDFFSTKEDVLKIKHPYKYEKLHQQVKNIWKYAEVDVQITVEAKIERNYDIDQ